jgi:hypothetical protein
MVAAEIRNTLQDAQDLLTQEAAEFLRFVVEEAAPVCQDEVDEKMLTAFREWYTKEQDLKIRSCTLIRDLGAAPDILQHPLELGYYNFARARIVAEKLAETCASDINFLEELQKDYEGCEPLHDRQLLALTNDYLAQRQAISSGIAELTS